MEIIYAAADSRDDVRLRTALITTPVDSRNTTGHTALMFAAEKGGVAAVNALIEKGADINARSNNGNSALMFASKRGHVAVIETLLQHGASCTAKNNIGDWALTFAVAEGRVAVAELILNNGGQKEIDCRNNDGETALMMACRNGRLSCMELLFNRHASDTIDTNEGKTAYDYCRDKKTLEHMHSVTAAYKAKMATEEAERRAQRYIKLYAYIKEVICSVRVKYLTDFKGKLFTRQASKSDLEACARLELFETYEMVPLLKSLSHHLSSRTDYSTLDKRLMCALGNPYASKVQNSKPLIDQLVNIGTIFPAEPAKRSDIAVYRTAYVAAIANILRDIEGSAEMLSADAGKQDSTACSSSTY